MQQVHLKRILEAKPDTPISKWQTAASVSAWAVASGGIAASLLAGTIIVPVGVAAIGGAIGFAVTKLLDGAEKRPGRTTTLPLP